MPSASSLVSFTLVVSSILLFHVIPARCDVPSSIHLALTGSIDQMVVSWFTSSYNYSSPLVMYGMRSGPPYDYQCTGTTTTYNKTVGLFHYAMLHSLQPSTTYYYKVGSTLGEWSAQYYFVSPSNQTALTPPELFKPFTMGIFGDMGSTHSEPTILRLIDRVDRGELDMIFHLGDISYADDFPSALYEVMWSRYFELLQPLMTRIPYMVTVGNNDIGCKMQGPCNEELPATLNFAAFRARFQMPAQQSGSPAGAMWFSFDHGPFHFISLSTETDFPGAPYGQQFGDQLDWLENDLAKANEPANRAMRPWIICGGHRPIYSSIVSFHFNDQPIANPRLIQAAFEPLFNKYNVDIFFTGHVHGYERMWPVYNSTVAQKSYTNANATIHIISGSAGNAEGMDPFITFSPLMPSWAAFRYIDQSPVQPFDWDQSAYSILIVESASTLRWQLLSSFDNSLVDEIVISKTL